MRRFFPCLISALWLLTATRAMAVAFDKGSVNGPGARAAGMGGAFVALADDAGAAYWNPAGLLVPGGQEISADFGSLLGTQFPEGMLTVRGTLTDWDMGVAASARLRGSGNGPASSEESGQISIALTFSDDRRFLFGASLKFLAASLEPSKALGLGMDLGFLYRLPYFGDRLSLGLSVADLQSALFWDNGFSQSVPQLIQGGVGFRLDADTRMEFDLESVSDYQVGGAASQGFRAGVEHWFPDWPMAVRVGYFQSNALPGRFTLGLGTRWLDLQADYAFIQDVNDLGVTNRLGLSWKFPGLPVRASAVPSPLPTPGPARTPAPTPAATPPVELTPVPTAAATPQAEIGLRAEAGIFSPTANSRRPEASFEVRAAHVTGLRSYRLEILAGRKTVRTLSGGRKLPGQLRWDGKDRRGKTAKDGSYTAVLNLAFKDGSHLSAQAEVELSSEVPAAELQAQPSIFNPRDPAASLALAAKPGPLAGKAQGWEVTLETADGGVVKTFKGSGVPGDALAWDGRDEAGKTVPAGTLFYAVYTQVMESGAVGRSARQPVESEIASFNEASALKVPLASIYFNAGEGSIDLDGYASLKAAADAVKKYGTNYLVQVRGYCDAQESGRGAAGPLELSVQRAKAAADYLVQAQNLPQERVAFAGYAAQHPLDAGGGQDVGKRNRRVEIILFTK